ncbi:MAG: hypothetical protein P0Y66_03095 [Candidatus Kaistia colombiensis]|nr:MAG: hypothetical protein P0Y66_03095 [Kaistia sp.]
MLARPGMTPDRLDAILARQMPDAEKARRAHFIVDTGGSKEASARPSPISFAHWRPRRRPDRTTAVAPSPPGGTMRNRTGAELCAKSSSIRKPPVLSR